MKVPNTLASDLTKAILEVCPILGVSLVDINNKNTWTIWFIGTVSVQQQSDAQAILENFDTSSYQ